MLSFLVELDALVDLRAGNSLLFVVALALFVGGVGLIIIDWKEKLSKPERYKKK